MNETKTIKCPYCGAVLCVKLAPGIESKSITCPICKQKAPFVAFKDIMSGKDEDHTHYPDSAGGAYEGAKYNKEETDIGDTPNLVLGRLIIPSLGLVYRLKVGRNVIGRKASASSADFQIPTDSRRMSREHLVIEVKKQSTKGFVHYASLVKEQVNKTCIGSEPLEYGDCIILSSGDIIKLPDMDVKFEIPDDDKTTM